MWHYCDHIERVIRIYDVRANEVPGEGFLRIIGMMFVRKIGELARYLTEEPLLLHSAGYWERIKDWRELLTAEGKGVSSEILWKIISEDIPELRICCRKVLLANRVEKVPEL